MSAVEVTAFRIPFEGVEHGFCRKEGVGRCVRNGWVDPSEFPKVLQVLNLVYGLIGHGEYFYAKIVLRLLKINEV